MTMCGLVRMTMCGLVRMTMCGLVMMTGCGLVRMTDRDMPALHYPVDCDSGEYCNDKKQGEYPESLVRHHGKHHECLVSCRGYHHRCQCPETQKPSGIQGNCSEPTDTSGDRAEKGGKQHLPETAPFDPVEKSAVGFQVE